MSTIDLLIEVACFVKKYIKFGLVSTWRSAVLSLLLQ